MEKLKLINNFRYFLGYEKYLNRATINNFSYEVGLFIDFKSDYNFAEVNFTDYLKFRQSKKVLSSGTVNNIIKALKNFYSFLHAEKLIEEDITYKLESIKERHKIPNILNCYQIYCIFEQFKTHTETSLRDAAIIETLYSTGCRIEELLSMPNGLHERENSTVIGKNDTERLVIFNSLAKNRINNYLAHRKCLSSYLFCNLKGKKLSQKYVNDMLEAIRIKAEIPFKVTAHTFRHSFAAHMMEGGANIIQVKDFLGHKTVKTTEIYTQFVEINHLRKELQLHHPRW